MENTNTVGNFNICRVTEGAALHLQCALLTHSVPTLWVEQQLDRRVEAEGAAALLRCLELPLTDPQSPCQLNVGSDERLLVDFDLRMLLAQLDKLSHVIGRQLAADGGQAAHLEHVLSLCNSHMGKKV